MISIFSEFSSKGIQVEKSPRPYAVRRDKRRHWVERIIESSAGLAIIVELLFIVFANETFLINSVIRILSDLILWRWSYLIEKKNVTVDSNFNINLEKRWKKKKKQSRVKKFREDYRPWCPSINDWNNCKSN